MKGTAKCIKSPNNIREKTHTKAEITPVPYSGGQGVPIKESYITRHRRHAAQQTLKDFIFINFTKCNKHWSNAGDSMRAWTKDKEIKQKNTWIKQTDFQL